LVLEFELGALHLSTLYHMNHAPIPFCFCFQIGSHFCPGPVLDLHPPHSASHFAGIIVSTTTPSLKYFFSWYIKT
jgi:hypothetical protein